VIKPARMTCRRSQLFRMDRLAAKLMPPISRSRVRALMHLIMDAVNRRGNPLRILQDPTSTSSFPSNPAQRTGFPALQTFGFRREVAGPDCSGRRAFPRPSPGLPPAFPRPFPRVGPEPCLTPCAASRCPTRTGRGCLKCPAGFPEACRAARASPHSRVASYTRRGPSGRLRLGFHDVRLMRI
jgi:hypothetical protein